jgi:diguanylate cyclase (GGDEF)-like protein
VVKSSLQEKITRLRNAFIAELPERMAQIAHLYGQLLTKGENPAQMEELHRLLHTIKGTSASFGMAELSRRAASAEDAAKTVLDYGWPETRVLERELGACLQGLYQVVDERDSKADAEQGQRAGFQISSADPQSDNLLPLIYLCDDDALQADYLAAQLRCFGYQVELFSHTEAVAMAVRQFRPHAIIMDIMFPGKPDGGLELLGLLQRNSDRPIPTIFMSARTDFSARLKAVQSGGNAYFTKPVTVLDIVDALDELTRRTEPEPCRVMIVDDDPAVSGYHALLLEDAGMITQVINSPELVLDALCDFKPDLILMDIYMPGCNGQELAQVIRQIPAYLSMPIVFLSSETNEAKQFTALRTGADGFLVKPIDPYQLVNAVAVRAERMRTLRGFMLRDSLTGLYNHTTIKQLLSNALVTAERNDHDLSFAMLDVDYFKQVNDRHGHPVGDQVLLALSRLLQQRLRQTDLVGRYGGEEFALILENACCEEATRIVDGLREDFSQVAFHAGQESFRCTFSAGVASIARYPDADSICAAADKALYAAKHAGRNRVMVNDADETGD